MSKLTKLSLSLAFCLGWAASAQAVPTTVTNTNCDLDGCRGADLKLEVEQQGTNWLVTYTIDTTNLDTNSGAYTGLNQIGFLAIKDWTDVQLQSAPNGTGNWTDPIEAIVKANALCEPSNGNSSKICSAAQSNFLNMTTPKGEYAFEFLVIGGSLMSTSEWHFSGQWANSLGAQSGQIISTGAGSPPAVPEPTAALLFAVGAVTVRQSIRRRS